MLALHRSVTALVCSAALMAGCSAPGSRLQSQPEVRLVQVGAALHHPVWSYRTNALVALTADQRLAAVDRVDDPDALRTRLSAPLDAGRNVQISGRDDRQVFVPQPRRDLVAVIDLAGLRQVGAFDAGPAPAYLSEDVGMRVLLALSADGSTVTPVDQYGLRKLPGAAVAETAIIDGANRGRAIEFHTYGPSGIRYYKGPSSPPEQRGTFDANIVAAAGDTTKVTRSYVADARRDLLYAIDVARGGEGLEEVGRAVLDSPIRQLGTDDDRVYVATDRAVAVFQASSFAGYPDGTIPLLRVIDYRSALPSNATHSALSGMAIGPDRVYLTFRDQPIVVSVAKPML